MFKNRKRKVDATHIIGKTKDDYNDTEKEIILRCMMAQCAHMFCNEEDEVVDAHLRVAHEGLRHALRNEKDQ